MRPAVKLTWTAVFVASSLALLKAQDLSPRAYVITPLRSNAVTLTYSYYSGSIQLNGVLPDASATGTYSVPIFTGYHSFGMFGRSANVNLAVPYGIGTFQGEFGDVTRQIYRSGLVDTTLRLSVNLKGGPAMDAEQQRRQELHRHRDADGCGAVGELQHEPVLSDALHPGACVGEALSG